MEEGFDPSSLKFNDLRDELRRRGLNPLGVKAVLLKRLSEALAKEDKTLEDFAKTLVEIKRPNESITTVEVDDAGFTEVQAMVSTNGDSAVVDKGGEESFNDVSKPKDENSEDNSNCGSTVQQLDCLTEVTTDTNNINQVPDSTTESAVERATEESNVETNEEIWKHKPNCENDSPQKGNVIEKTRGEPISERRGHYKEKNKISRDRSRKRKSYLSANKSPNVGRDGSSDRKKRKSSRKTRDGSLMIEDEIEGWEDREDVFLDFYNSDLSLVINQDCYSARPMTNEGFALMWAGARANYGVKSGKIFFEVKVVRELPIDDTDESIDSATHVLRVGWSVNKSSLILGEEVNSFGLESTGKKSTNGKFEDYGISFKEGDVVGAYLEFTDSEFIITFSVNGTDQGECFRFEKSYLGENAALFPHIYVKNVEFSVNFGQNDQPAWFPSTEAESWKLIGNVPVTERVRGLLPPAKKEDCEVIMMIGLPGCGKTYFSENLLQENPEKYYNVLGTKLIFEKVMGLSKKRNYSGPCDILINKANRCLNKIISIACKRKRNYVLDQTNIYPKVQRRKMRPFDGFQRKAIVIVPTDEEFKRRIEQRIKEDGKVVPEKALLGMKADFRIPKPVSDDPASMFDEVTFPELQREEAETLVNEYNAEGEANRSQDRRQMADSPEHLSRHSRRRRGRRSRYERQRLSSGRGGYDGRESRGSRFDFRDDDRGRFGSQSRDDYGRGGCDCCRFGCRGGRRYDDEPDYCWGSPGYGFQCSSRGAGGPYFGSPFAHPPFHPGGPQYGGPPSYGPPSDSPYRRGEFSRGPPGPAERGGPDSYPRGGRGSYGGDYGPGGYGYHLPGQRRRFDDSDSDDPSTGPPPSKQPAYGSKLRGGGYLDDSYRGGFRRGRGSGEKGSLSGPSASGSGYAYGYESSCPPTAGQSKGGDSSTPGRYPGSRADEFQSKSQGPYASSELKPSRFSSTAGEADKSISKPSDSPGSRFRSSGYQGYEVEKEIGQQPRSRFDQSNQQSQDPYLVGGTFGQPGAGRQLGPTGGSTQRYGYGQYAQQQQGRNTASESSKSLQGYGGDFGNRGPAPQQQSQKAPQTGHGGEFGSRGSNLPSSQQSQNPQQGAFRCGFGSPYGRQQPSYGTDAYGQRSATGSGTNPNAPKFQQQNYGGSGTYGPQSGAQSAQGQSGYDCSSFFGASAYGYGQGGDKSVTTVSKPEVPTAASGNIAGGSSLYASAMTAASKGIPAASASNAYGSTGQPAQQQQMPTSAYGYGGAVGYYGTAATAVQAPWPPYGGVAPDGQWGGIGNSGGASLTRQGYGYGQR